jgi:hypothetical protein
MQPLRGAQAKIGAGHETRQPCIRAGGIGELAVDGLEVLEFTCQQPVLIAVAQLR